MHLSVVLLWVVVFYLYDFHIERLYEVKLTAWVTVFSLINNCAPEGTNWEFISKMIH